MAEQEYMEIMGRLDRIEKMLLTNNKEVLSPDECALMINISTSRLYALTSQRAIPFYKPSGGKIFFRKSEIEEWILSNRKATNKELESIAATHCVINERKPRKRYKDKK